LELELGGERVGLIPPAGAHLPDQRALLVADLHLGKGAAFRAAGRPVPAGTSAETLERLSALLRATPRGTALWILGDLFHSPSGVTPGLEERWRRWRAEHPDTTIHLVHGNHDRTLLGVARHWGCRVVSAPARLGGLELRHIPRERHGSPDDGPGVAGHLHPAVLLREGRRSSLRLPCFWLRGPDLVLPALGAFVDGAKLSPFVGDRIFVPVGDQILEVPPAQLPSSARTG
jgi:DNA ligase-associated metallophosphoesterase